MFKKSDTRGDKTQKHEIKGDASKAANAVGQPAPTTQETAAPANEAKKS
jgi:hypothetical protein